MKYVIRSCLSTVLGMCIFVQIAESAPRFSESEDLYYDISVLDNVVDPSSKPAFTREAWAEVIFWQDKQRNTQVVLGDVSGTRSYQSAASNYGQSQAKEKLGQAPEGYRWRMEVVFDANTGQHTGTRVDKYVTRNTKKVLSLLEKGKHEDAAKILEELDPKYNRNLREGFLFWVAKASYYKAVGDVEAQVKASRTALKQRYSGLTQNVVDSLQLELLLGEIQIQRFADAKDRADMLASSLKNAELRSAVIRYQKAIDGLLLDDLLQINATPNAEGLWQHRLYHNAFYFQTPPTGTSDFQLRCDNKRTVLKVNQGSQSVLQLPESWGQCVLSVFSEPKAEFTLIEVAPSAFE